MINFLHRIYIAVSVKIFGIEWVISNYTQEVVMPFLEKYYYSELMKLANGVLVSEKILEKISISDDFGLKGIVARNLYTPIHILDSLSEDQNYEIRAMVASNSFINESILIKLSKDKSIVVVGRVLENWKTPDSVYEDYILKHMDK